MTSNHHCNNNEPDILWHYTTIEAFTSIFNTKIFRATDSAFLNDINEHTRPLQAIVEKLDPQKHVKDLRDYIKNIKKRCYIISLTQQNDSIPHWREYTDSKMGGVAIGFSRQGLEEHLCNQTNQSLMYLSLLDKCIYEDFDNIDENSMINNFCKKAEDFFAFNPNNADYKELIHYRDIGIELQSKSRKFPHIKSKDFEYEKEWRLSFIPLTSQKKNLEIGFANYKPFLPITISKLEEIIKEIKISPLGNVEQNHLYCELLTDSAKIKVTDSNKKIR